MYDATNGQQQLVAKASEYMTLHLDTHLANLVCHDGRYHRCHHINITVIVTGVIIRATYNIQRCSCLAACVMILPPL